MKTLVFVACLLAISYAADPQKVKEYYDNYRNCLNKLNMQQMTSEVAECLFRKYDLIDKQGVILKEKLFERYQDIISDETKLNQAKEIASRCIEKAYEGPGCNDEKIMVMTIQCMLPIANLFDKLQ